MGIYLLSTRQLLSSVALDPIYELEDLMVESCDAQLHCPQARSLTQWLAQVPGSALAPLTSPLRGSIRPYHPISDLALSNGPNLLLLIVTDPSWVTILSSVPQWRKRFDVVAAYIFDAWETGLYPPEARSLDHLFVPMPELVAVLHRHLGIPVSLLPFASDVLTHGSATLYRGVDLLSYGRIPPDHHRTFACAFNHPQSSILYYRSTPRPTERFPTQPYDQRRERLDNHQLYQFLRHTKLAIAYDTLFPGMREFPHSFVTLRWFQAGAAGCAIVGKRPTTPLADQLLDWDDATLELDDDPHLGVEQIRDLLQDSPRLHQIHPRNYREHRDRHDWRYRLQQMFTILGLSVPETLEHQIRVLKGPI